MSPSMENAMQDRFDAFDDMVRDELILTMREMLSVLKMAQVELRPRRSFVDMPSRPGDVEDLRQNIDAAIARAEGLKP